MLGRPCYTKFMVIPNYTYLKLKMPSPKGVITHGTSFQRAYEYEMECYELTAATIASEEPVAIKGNSRGGTQLQAASVLLRARREHQGGPHRSHWL
jgi:hypothetical protein